MSTGGTGDRLVLGTGDGNLTFIVAQPGPAATLPAAEDTLTRVRPAAVLLATGVLVTGFGAGGAPPPRGSVPACTAAVVQAVGHRVPLTTVTAACRGLSRAGVDLAVGRAIFEVAGTGQHKTDWRRRAAVAGARLAQVIGSLERHAVRPGPAAPPPPGARPAPPPPGALAGRWGTGLATLAAWLLTMAAGAFMLAGWIRRGGLHRRDGRTGLAPWVTLGHVAVASAGLLAWIAYLVTGWTALAWLAVGVLLAAIGLGMATLTVWTARAARGRAGPPGPAPGGPRGRPGDLRIVLPVVHGLTASATILLALLTAVTAR
jgi:hypothetical protein